MPAAALPADEADRLRRLRSSGLLERAGDPRLDAIVHSVAELFDVSVAAVTLLDQSRQVFKASIGTGVPHTPRSVAFCGHTILGRNPLIVLDAAQDPRFADNPLVTVAQGIRFYAGAPVFGGATTFGALCVLSTTARAAVTPEQVHGLQEMAHAVSAILSAQDAPSGA